MSSGILPIRLIGSGYDKPPVLEARSNWTVEKLYEDVASLKQTDTSTFSLMILEELLDLKNDSKKLLIEYGIIPNDSLIFCEKMIGGSNLQPMKGHVSLTKEPCCVTYDENPAEWRAKLACGHVVAVDTVKTICEGVLKEGGYKFQCPGSSCDLELSLTVVRHILSSAMTSNDLNVILDRMQENFLRNPGTDIRQCKVCGVNWKKDRRVRIACNTCSRNQKRQVLYCWVCRQEWRGGSNRCGNPGCDGDEQIQVTLQSCETKKIGGVSGCPIIRACPRCSTLIHHKDQCKHMECKCGCEFCFVCLKQKEIFLWRCGTHNSRCAVAPRQTVLPSYETGFFARIRNFFGW